MKISVIETGLFKLDGGAMFGIVPKKMWSKLNPPDENNLCTWALRALLVETDDRKILFDTGIGNKQDSKWRTFFEPHGDASLFGSLAAVGVRPEDITDVFLTHLHFDHCGGSLFHNVESGETRLAFPKAKYWTNRRHFDWAMNSNPREKASFLLENFAPLAEHGVLHFLETRQNVEFAPGIRVRFFNGHTEAMMVPSIRVGDRDLIYCADALPSQWHVGMPYVMAYDIRPLVTLKEKEKMLTDAARRGDILFFEHDPTAECGEVAMSSGGRIILKDAGRLADRVKIF